MLFLIAGLTTPAFAQTVPNRTIPPTVLTELRLLENRFELALSMDCAPERCFSKGCTYVDHAVADQPANTNLPGLGLSAGPGSVPPQEYLTRARCNFAHEESVETKDVQALTRRLQAKLSQAWTSVSVGHQKLPPLPPYLLTEPELEDTDVPELEEEAEPEPVAAVPEEWSLGLAVRELWNQLLPHFFWMIGLGLVTFATMLLIWAWRRVGRASFEEQALLASLQNPEPAPPEPEAVAETPDEDPADFVVEQTQSWNDKLAAMDPTQPDLEIQALIRHLLRTGEMALLAKAVLQFPDTFPNAFPSGGEIASAKLELADYLTNVHVNELPDDATFFAALNRHALSATLASQSDAEIVRTLRDEFGAAGLVDLIGKLGARPAALLFSLSPVSEQQEMVRLLTPNQTAHLAEELLRSNRMDPNETTYLFDLLEAVRTGNALPQAPRGEVSDRGPTHDATGALSVLLPQLSPTTRAALFNAALERFSGSLPSWYRGIFYADLLFALPDEARTDLLLALDVKRLSAWFSLLDRDTKQRLLANAPNSLKVSLTTGGFASREQQLALADTGRNDLAAGFQRELARAGMRFESVMTGSTA